MRVGSCQSAGASQNPGIGAVKPIGAWLWSAPFSLQLVVVEVVQINRNLQGVQGWVHLGQVHLVVEASFQEAIVKAYNRPHSLCHWVETPHRSALGECQRGQKPSCYPCRSQWRGVEWCAVAPQVPVDVTAVGATMCSTVLCGPCIHPPNHILHQNKGIGEVQNAESRLFQDHGWDGHHVFHEVVSPQSTWWPGR